MCVIYPSECDSGVEHAEKSVFRISKKIFRNFDRPFPEKEVRDALSNPNKISSEARHCPQQLQPKQTETHKYK